MLWFIYAFPSAASHAYILHVTALVQYKKIPPNEEVLAQSLSAFLLSVVEYMGGLGAISDYLTFTR